MRVVLLGPFPPPHGGVQTNLVDIRDFLRRKGIRCKVINITSAAPSGAEDVDYPRSAWELMRLLMRRDFDVLHLHIGGHLSARLVALCAICTVLPGVRTVLTFHSGGYPSSPAGRSARPSTLRGFVLRRFDRIITVNSELTRLFHRFGCSPERVLLIEPHAVSRARIPREAAVHALPGRFRQFFADHDPVLLTVCQLEPAYDIGLQIEAMGEIVARHPRAGLLIAGGGKLYATLADQIASSPVAGHIMLAGDVTHEHTLDAMAASHVVLRTTHFDGDSISVREALGLGRPVVATRTEMRPAGVRLIPIGDGDALVAAVDEVLAVPATITDAGSDSTQARDANVAKVLAVYEEIAR